MKKFEISYEEKSIAGEELDKYQDFDGILGRHGRYMTRQRMKKRLVITLSMIILPGLLVFGYLNRDMIPFIQFNPFTKKEVKDVEPKVERFIEESSKVEIIDEEPAAEYVPEAIAKKTVKKERSGVDNVKIIRDRKIRATPAQGYGSLFQYFENAIVYPKKSLERGVSGPVKVVLWINDKGKVEKIRILNGINKELNEEALRVINNMPAWKPAVINGQPYRSQIALTVMFVIR